MARIVGTSGSSPARRACSCSYSPCRIDLWPNPLTWLFAAGFVAVLVASVVFYVRMEKRSRDRDQPARG